MSSNRMKQSSLLIPSSSLEEAESSATVCSGGERVYVPVSGIPLGVAKKLARDQQTAKNLGTVANVLGILEVLGPN
jgi:hypothetical protein